MVMENTFPEKIQTNGNQRKHIHNFLLEVSHTIKTQNFDHQNWSDFFLKLFSFARLNRFLYFWVFIINSKIQPVGS